jgi:hypothetical protein
MRHRFSKNDIQFAIHNPKYFFLLITFELIQVKEFFPGNCETILLFVPIHGQDILFEFSPEPWQTNKKGSRKAAP